MDEMTNDVPQVPRNPRRRKRSKVQIFKESYLPVIVFVLAALLIISFIAGAVIRSNKKKKQEQEESLNALQSQQNLAAQQSAEAQRLLAEAALLAAEYDYQGAIDTLDQFTGDMANFDDLSSKRAEYADALSKMVAWDDLSQIPNLSFHGLIADPSRAFVDPVYKNSYKKNYVTITEFSKILESLYANGYILVSLDDVVETVTDESGNTTYAPKTLYLPAGKKPLMITQTSVNYYLYMTDSDNDYLADQGGAGFASKLIVAEDGRILNEYVDASGNTLTGAYDVVPILDAFIAAHPDFSYRGAKAILAVSGYNGVFGYRTQPDAEAILGTEAYLQEIAGAKQIIAALRNDGYEIACYTYRNIAYGEKGAPEIQVDLNSWNTEVVPLLGEVDILVFAQLSDIGDTNPYSGTKFNILQNAGFKFYLGFANGGMPWASIPGDYVRMGRIMVTGTNLIDNGDYFSGMFNAAAILDERRSDY